MACTVRIYVICPALRTHQAKSVPIPASCFILLLLLLLFFLFSLSLSFSPPSSYSFLFFLKTRVSLYSPDLTRLELIL